MDMVPSFVSLIALPNILEITWLSLSLSPSRKKSSLEETSFIPELLSLS
jgi:hypothetical protein